MKVFFTSDLHFSHTNIIKHEDRPFKDAVEMDNELIKRWNNKVTNKDVVYVLGDFCMIERRSHIEDLVSRLNGREIHLLKGNHDYFAKKAWSKELFASVDYYKELKHNGYTICMMHYPIAQWNKKHYGSIHLFGHIHSNHQDHHPMNFELGRALNVGVDIHNYEPLSFEEVCEKLEIPTINQDIKRKRR